MSTRAVTPVEVVSAYAAADGAEKHQWQVDSDSPVALVLAGESRGVETERRAIWHQPGHPDVSAVRIDGQWKLIAGILASRVAATPAQAMALLSRAVTVSDAALMRALMPTTEQKHWSLSRVEAFLKDPQYRPPLVALVQRLALSPEVGPPSERDGTVTVGDLTGQVVLVREKDGWKVLDLRPHERFGPVEAPTSDPAATN